MLDLILFAAAHDQSTDATREMHDAIVDGWSAGPIGVLDALVLVGITVERVDRVTDLEDDLAYVKADLDAADDRVAELESEVEQDDRIIEGLREEIALLREQVQDIAS